MTIVRVNPGGWTDDTTTVTAAQLNLIDANITRAVDGTDGGTFAPTAAITVNGSGIVVGGSGLTISGTGNVKLASRSNQRSMPILAAVVDSNWSYDSTNGWWINAAASGNLEFDLIGLPHGQVLTAVGVYVDGGAHGGAWPPANAPELTLIRTSTTGTRSVIHTEADSLVNQGTFEAGHWLSMTALAHTINTSVYRYSCIFQSEWGANWAAGTTLHSIACSVTSTSYAEW